MDPADTPVPTPFADAASPFQRTAVPVIPGPPPSLPAPEAPPAPQPSTWVTYRPQINFGLTLLAFLMVLVGSATAVQANPAAQWRYYVAVLPLAPAAVALFLFMRALGRLDEVQTRVQMQAFGLSVAATGLLAFGYGFLEGAGLPHLNSVWVLPLLAVFWGAGYAFLTWRQR
jgi:hypothetical protein